MKRRYRFLTDPRIFNYFTDPCINRVQFFLTFIIALPAFHILMLIAGGIGESDVQDRMVQDVTAARAEVLRLKAEIRRLKAAETEPKRSPLSTSPSIKGSAETAPTPTTPAPDANGGVMPAAETLEVIQSGPLKGVPLEIAKEIQEEYRQASMARATRYHEWDKRRRALIERDVALAKKELAHGDALLADSKKMREHILSVYASMSPEQLEVARQEALKTQPAEDVDLFFRHVSDFGTATPADQIDEDTQALQVNEEILASAWAALKAEREQINREQDELMQTKPPSPNIDFNVFYTEWKERNSAKLSP